MQLPDGMQELNTNVYTRVKDGETEYAAVWAGELREFSTKPAIVGSRVNSGNPQKRIQGTDNYVGEIVGVDEELDLYLVRVGENRTLSEIEAGASQHFYLPIESRHVCIWHPSNAYKREQQEVVIEDRQLALDRLTARVDMLMRQGVSAERIRAALDVLTERVG